MDKPYSKLSPDELREYHRAAWRRYYQRNRKALNKRKRDWEKDNYDKERATNRKATKKYKDKTRLSGMRAVVLERDNHRCTTCERTTQLVIHHKDEVSWHNSPKPNNEVSNLVTLCRSCHTKLHNRLRSGV
jgi:5-methylcytosine-specific restriction endonuclease McrA